MPTKTTKKKTAAKTAKPKKPTAAKPAPKHSSGGTRADGSPRADAVSKNGGASELIYCRVPAEVIEQLDSLAKRIAMGGGPNRSQAMRYAISLGITAAAKRNP